MIRTGRYGIPGIRWPGGLTLVVAAALLTVAACDDSTGPGEEGALRFTSLSANNNQTCGVDEHGVVYCWGGPLGRFQGNIDPGPPNRPRRVSGSLTFREISAGGGYTCGIASTERGWCWGWNDKGQLGDGTVTDSEMPVALLLDDDIVSISAGGGHTCAITTDGAAWCWGTNFRGELGNGESSFEIGRPVAVSGELSFTEIQAGSAFSCAQESNGRLYCWGDNGAGKLGTGAFDPNLSPVPVQAADGLAFVQYSVGGAHVCGIDEAGRTQCWGWNEGGQLGDGSREDSPSPVEVETDIRFAALSAGDLHTCGLTQEGSAYCWGVNLHGQLGDGTTEDRAAPVLVAGDLTFQSLSAGGEHTCGLTEDGLAFCWGRNLAGQLGDGTTTDRLVPTPVASPE